MSKTATAKTNVVLVDAVRTPFGKAGSLYSGTRADDIMVRCIRGLLERNPNLPIDQIDDVAIAAATQTGDQGMNIGRSVSILAGIPKTVPGYSIDRWCAGALTAVTTIAGGINMGAYDLAIAGGVEHMGNHPMGDGIDPNPRYLAEKIVDNDALQMGATAAILASESKAKELNLSINAKMISFAFAGVEPEIMGYGPVPSTIKALKKAGLDIGDIGLFEVNEAFAIQVLSFLDHFGIADDDKRVNIYGGAIAVGHPLASSGVRLMLNLANGFKEHPEVKYGITTMCIGLGMGGTVIWENPNYKGDK